MSNTIEYGQGAVNNTIGWGQGAKVGGSSFSNTLSTTFDGIDDFVDCGNISSINSASVVSISTWVKKSSSINTNISVGSLVSSTNGIWLHWFTDNTVYFTVRNGAFMTTSYSLSGNTDWNHIVGVYNGVNSKIYINGNLVVTGTNVPTSLSSTAGNNFQIGAIDGGFFTSGLIDETAIFNSELTQSDITAIYNGGVPTSLLSYSSLVSWYRMGDNDNYPTISDNKGSNDGTMTNMSSANFVTDVPT